MPSNIEIKASIINSNNFHKLAASISDTNPVILKQIDTFFATSKRNQRLKLRHIQGNPKGELIQYERSDSKEAKCSNYSIYETSDTFALESVLATSLGVRGRVRKTRTLYMVGQTRIHVDDVDGLGHFMELEVVMKDGQSLEEGQSIAQSLMKQLLIEPQQLVNCAYIDLLQRQQT